MVRTRYYKVYCPYSDLEYSEGVQKGMLEYSGITVEKIYSDTIPGAINVVGSRNDLIKCLGELFSYTPEQIEFKMKYSHSNTIGRENREEKILNAFRKGPLTINELCNLLGLSHNIATTINQMVKEKKLCVLGNVTRKGNPVLYGIVK